MVAGLRALVDLPGFYAQAATRYGARWLLRLPERDWLLCAEPEDAVTLLAADPAVARAGEASASLEPIGGSRSVVLLDGPEHLRARRSLLPAFHGDRMRAHQADMEEETDRMIDGWSEGQVVGLHAAVRSLTFSVILRATLGIRDPARAREAVARIEKLFGGAALAIYVPALQRDLGPLSPWRRFLALREQADGIIRAELRARRAEGDLADRDDVLSMLLRARDDDGAPLSDEELRDQLMTLLVAGHETTTAAIAWTVDALLRHPQALARLREELAGDGHDYLEAVIQEGLRHHPPVPMFGRVLAAPLRVGPYTAPAGVAVGVNTWSLHRREDLFPEPERFRPERFLDGAPPPNAYLPFGGAVRRCLGAAFANQELRVVIGRLVGRCELELASRRPEGHRLRGVTLVPARGVRVRVRAIDP